jgi:hypothetical protein
MNDSDERRDLPSASSWRRFELCAGSYQLEQEARAIGQEAHIKSLAAVSGERIHARLAGDKEVVLTDSEEMTAKFLSERLAEQISRIFADEKTEQIIEQRLWLYLDEKQALSGRVDRVIFTEKTALLIDFKSGFSEPDEAVRNSQLKVLSVLVGLRFPNIEEVVAQVISGPYGISETRYNLEQLGTAYSDIVSTLRKIHNPNAPLVAGVEQCRYCPAQLICLANRDLITPITKLRTTKLPEDSERSSRLLDEITVLRKCFDEIERYYFERLSSDPDFKIDGYDLVPNTPRREINDVKAAKLRLTEYLSEDQLNEISSITITGIEKGLSQQLKLKGKELRARTNEILQGLITEKTPAPSLKRTSKKVLAVKQMALNGND